MLRRDAHGMPPLGSTVADACGSQLISVWIAQLPGCGAGSGTAGVTCTKCHVE